MRKIKKKIKHDLIWVILKVFIALVNILPLGIIYHLANGLASLAWILGIKRRMVFVNLIRAFAKEKSYPEIKAITRETYRNIAKNICELSRIFKFSREEIDRMFIIQGKEYLDAALARGRGVIGLSAHLGNFPLMGAKLVQEGYPCASFIYGTNAKRVIKLFLDMGRHLGINLIPVSPSHASVHHALKWLRENKILAIQIDRNSPQGVFVNFFGHLAATSTGLAILAKRTGATILPMFTVRERNNKHRIIFEPPVELEIMEDRKKEILVNTAKFTKIVESYVRKYPTQWLWTYNRWGINSAPHRGAG